MTRTHYRAVSALLTLLDRIGIKSADDSHEEARQIYHYSRSMV